MVLSVNNSQTPQTLISSRPAFVKSFSSVFGDSLFWIGTLVVIVFDACFIDSIVIVFIYFWPNSHIKDRGFGRAELSLAANMQ